MTFEKNFPGLMKSDMITFKTKKKEEIIITPHNTIIMPICVLEDNCRDNQRIKEALEAAVHGVMFKGYDKNSEKALIEMQNYIYKELKL